MTLGVYFKVIYQLQSSSNVMICSCKISTDSRVVRSFCDSRASWSQNRAPASAGITRSPRRDGRLSWLSWVATFPYSIESIARRPGGGLHGIVVAVCSVSSSTKPSSLGQSPFQHVPRSNKLPRVPDLPRPPLRPIQPDPDRLGPARPRGSPAGL